MCSSLNMRVLSTAYEMDCQWYSLHIFTVVYRKLALSKITSIVSILYFCGRDLLKPSTTILNEAVSDKYGTWKNRIYMYCFLNITSFKAGYKRKMDHKRILNGFVTFKKKIRLQGKHYYWIMGIFQTLYQIFMCVSMAP